MKLNIPRSFRTSDEDFQRHWYTRGCPGCKSLVGRTTGQKQSDLCRQRMSEALSGQKRVEEAKERTRRFVEEALKEEEVNREKGQKKSESKNEKPIQN